MKHPQILICRYCGANIQYTYGDVINKSMSDQGACFGCNIWLDRVADIPRGNKTRNGVQVIRANHCYYTVGDPQDIHRGFGGQTFRFFLLDTDMQIETSNLWYGGEIPILWRSRLPDNAIRMNQVATPPSCEGVSS